MDVLEIIEKKKDNKELTYSEIEYLIKNYVEGIIPDYQMSAFLMSVCLKGMTKKETYYLTDVFLNSGDKLDLSFVDKIKIDKHSTGAVGDKTTLVVGPIVAAAGIPVLKMSGRSLGHTGGTIDKLESIAGFNVNLTNEEFINQSKDIGIVITSQTGNLVPADKKTYALRDVSGTTSSIPLIASSIMSKKLASGADKIVLDVKVGKGAFIKTIEEARELSKLMVDIGNNANKETICCLTNANYPLGYTVGNALEVLEAIDTLNCKGEKRFLELCLSLSSLMISLGKQISLEKSKLIAVEMLNSKKALEKLKELIKSQNGDINNIKTSKFTRVINSNKEGYINSIDPLKISKIVFEMGAGRLKKEDKIDLTVGIKFNKVIGDYINNGECIATIYYNPDKDVDNNEISEAFIIGEKQIEDNIIVDIIK